MVMNRDYISSLAKSLNVMLIPHSYGKYHLNLPLFSSYDGAPPQWDCQLPNCIKVLDHKLALVLVLIGHSSKIDSSKHEVNSARHLSFVIYVLYRLHDE